MATLALLALPLALPPALPLTGLRSVIVGGGPSGLLLASCSFTGCVSVK